MAAPLFQHLLQPTKFDEYLDEIGLEHVTPEARVKMVDDLTEIVQYRIVTEAFSSLTDEEKEEYIALMQEAVKDDNYIKSNQFLYQHIPDIEAFVDEIVQEELSKLKPGAAVFRKVTEEFLFHLKKRQQYELEPEPNLPLDTKLIPPTPDKTLSIEELKKISARPLEYPIAEESNELIGKSESFTGETSETKDLVDNSSDDQSSTASPTSNPFPWELPPLPETPARSEQPTNQTLTLNDDSRAGQAIIHTSSQAINDELEAIQN